MKYNQNDKILQITATTLIIGVDVASEIHYARAFDYRGVELGITLKFYNDDAGFRKFHAWVAEAQNRQKKDKVIVGMEPTGHYWFPLAGYLKESHIKFVLVNPYHVKRSKELDDNNPSKSDRKDPKTIALLVKDGRYSEPYIPEGIYGELRLLMQSRWQIIKQLNAVRNRTQRWLSIYFPEFKNVFGSWEGKAALILLQEMPTPEQIVAQGTTAIKARWQQDKIRGVGIKRAQAIVEAARKSIGVKNSLQAARNELSILLETYAMHQRHYESTMRVVEELVQQIPGIAEILKISGIGMATAAGFLAEVGDINRFSHSEQIQKLAGLNVAECSSGKYKGQSKISKRGRRQLRSVLFQAVLPLVAKNAEFRELHAYYTKRSQNPLKKKQSLIVLSCKLIRILFVILKKGIAYDGKKMIADIQRANHQTEKAA